MPIVQDEEEPVASAMFRSGSNRSYAKTICCWQWNGMPCLYSVYASRVYDWVHVGDRI